MTRVQRRFIEVVLSDKLENLVVEVEAIPGEDEDVFGNLRSVRVRVWDGGAVLLRLLLMARRRERRLHTELALAFTAFGGDIFGGGEGEKAEGERTWLRRTVEDAAVKGKR